MPAERAPIAPATPAHAPGRGAPQPAATPAPGPGLGQSLLAAAGAALLFAVAMGVASWRGTYPLSTYLRDPAAEFDFSPFAGIVSFAGIFVLVAASTVCLVAARHGRETTGLFAAAGLFGLVIAADDLLLLHENILPRLLGVGQSALFAGYALAALAVFYRYRGDLRQREAAGLWLAVGLLGLSVMLDRLVGLSEAELVVEDGLKFTGLVVWAQFWITRADASLRAR